MTLKFQVQVALHVFRIFSNFVGVVCHWLNFDQVSEHSGSVYGVTPLCIGDMLGIYIVVLWV